ncbi:MAG: hypothetical protein KCHDKBKB_01605 [Elusimicrobia bacterium]|nr:hypothetical protein [Elusimicrobiota bacterium]
MKKINVVLVAVAAGLFVQGCAGPSKMIGSQRIVERMPSREPEWKSLSQWEKKDQLYFVGAVMNVSDMALGFREAKAEAEKKIAEQIKERIRTEFGKAVEGQNIDNQLGVYVKDVIVKVSENVPVSGIAENERFTERYEETTGFGIKYGYNCFVLLALHRADYLEARKNVLEGAVEQAKREKNIKAEESLKAAFEKLED